MNKRWNFCMFVLTFSLAAGSLFSFGSFVRNWRASRNSLGSRVSCMLGLASRPIWRAKRTNRVRTKPFNLYPLVQAFSKGHSPSYRTSWVLVHDISGENELDSRKNKPVGGNIVVSDEDSMPSLDESFTSDKLKIGYFTALFLFNKLMDV